MSDEPWARLERIMQVGFETLADLQRETNARLDQTNARLDQTNMRLERLEGRFDNFLEPAGTEVRELRGAVRALERRVDEIERKTA